MMLDNRQHKRTGLKPAAINGQIILTHNVTILDISLGGATLKTDRILNVGKDYLILLENKGRHVGVRGIVARCELSDIEERDNGQGVSVYTAGVTFKGTSSSVISEFIDSLEEGKKEEENDNRLGIKAGNESMTLVRLAP